MTLPALFVSHGAPNIILHDSPTRRFLAGLGETMGRPRAVVAISAHWEARVPTVGSTANPGTIHDFYGFEPAMYEMRYPAPGAPELAAEVARSLRAAGLETLIDERRGLDHGAWVPLKLMYPRADIPVMQLAVQTHESPRHHHLIGQILRDLREDNVLVLGSGNATHNLREMMSGESNEPAWVTAFADWLRTAVTAGASVELLDYRNNAPFAARNHPTEEHFLPLLVALGAGTPGVPGRIIHSSTSFGVLAMDAFAFD